jgi:hypothetical protein
MIWLARLFVVSPMVVIYFFHETHHGMFSDRVSAAKWFGATLVCLSVIWVWDVARKPPRTLPSVILARMLITSMIVFSVVLMLGGGWYFWFILSHCVVWMLVWLQLTVHRIAHHLVYPHDPNGNYHQVRQAGWHPFWDKLPSLFNPDTELIRNGGFEEPQYTNFVPPADWKFQCPVCGARQQTSFCVCWNPECRYGADGDSTAYYERWGS